MTEIEKIAYAKSFIEKLANGIDPLTGQAVPDTDLINNVRISRCFFYVSDILRQVIEQGGVSGKKAKTKKLPFQLDCEERQKFRFSPAPIPISEIEKRLSELIDTERMAKLSYKHITDWLIEFGALTVITEADGKTVKRPTSVGADIGISTEERQGQNRAYTVVLYNLEAQRFILDNLDAVIELSQRPKE